MYKESRFSAAVQSKGHQKQARQRNEPKTLKSSHLISSDPCVSEQSLGSNLSGVGAMNRTNTNWGSTGPKEMSRSHGWTSNSRGVRKTSQGNNEFSSQDRFMGKRSLDVQKKGFLGARSSPNSAERSKPVKSDFVPFEVRMNDFPELAGNKSAPCHVENWRSASLSSSSPKQSPAPSWTSGRREIPSQPECQQITTNTTSDSSTIAQSQAAVTSWANIASQPPRKPASHKSKIYCNLQSEDNPEQQEDVTSRKKKRRKKKKQTKSEDVEAESEGPASYQEPPKIEDEEEFPDLFLSLTVNDRMMPSSKAAKLCYEEIQKEGFYHLNDPSKENLNLPKGQVGAQNTQKTEKMSGKKSKAPVQLDIGNVLATLEKKQQTQNRQDAKSVILSVGGGLPVVQKQTPVQKKLPWQKDKIAHNPLDSTSPLVKKGKQREVPKAKKPTPLKKVILKEREERKQKRLLEERGLLPEQECQPEDEAAEEEQHNTSEPSSEVGRTAEELSDLSALNDADQVAKDCDEELETDQTVEQQTAASPSVSYTAGRLKIHSRKFRDYCTQMLSKDVDECVTILLKELVRFQDRLYQKDPMKARMKRRIVMGLREVQKHLKLRKLKCVIISPNCERIQSKGGLDEALHTIIDTCREQAVPFVFALSRKALGRCVNKAVPVSLVGIFNYDGAQDFYHKMIELSSEARTAYEVMLSNLEQTDAEEAQQTSPLAEKVESSSGDPQPEEPEYLKIWNKIFKQDCSNQRLNFEKQLSLMHLESECIETTNGEKS